MTPALAMRRLRPQQWAAPLLRPATPFSSALSRTRLSRTPCLAQARLQSSTAAAASPITTDRHVLEGDTEDPSLITSRSPYPSPLPERALHSPKLAALHARLCLSSKLPLQTLARALVDPSADENPNFNNLNLAFVGSTIINYHTSEWLICKFPRLPMGVLYEAMRAFAGPKPLFHVAMQWGVESAGAPGGEVDPGLLQWSSDPEKAVQMTSWGYVRTEAAQLDKFKWRRGMSSRVVLDDSFGETVHQREPKSGPTEIKTPGDIQDAARAEMETRRNDVYSRFVQAVVGAIYVHCGREAARSFIKAHILSRQLAFEKLFAFKKPTVELAKLCQRENLKRPVARLESETGRLSRTPVFVVGIYSGRDKLAEGTGSSLDHARLKAVMNALKAWYLYSPGRDVRVPSDMLIEGAAPWTAPHIDPGEII